MLLLSLALFSAVSAYSRCDVLSFSNDYRQSKGLSRVKGHHKLDKAAEFHCQNMITHGYSHNAKGYGVADRANIFDYSFTALAENIFKGPGLTPGKAVEGWINSEGKLLVMFVGHKGNLLGDYTHMGVAHCKDRSGQDYWAQVFGRGDMRGAYDESQCPVTKAYTPPVVAKPIENKVPKTVHKPEQKNKIEPQPNHKQAPVEKKPTSKVEAQSNYKQVPTEKKPIYKQTVTEKKAIYKQTVAKKKQDTIKKAPAPKKTIVRKVSQKKPVDKQAVHKNYVQRASAKKQHKKHCTYKGSYKGTAKKRYS